MKILAYRGLSWISKAIRWQTRSKYSHIGIELNDGSVIEAWHIGGVKRNKTFRTVHSKKTKVDVFEITGQYDEKKVLEFLTMQIGHKYDFRSIVRFITRKSSHISPNWFCSELANEAFRKGGLDLLSRISSSHISPRDIGVSPMLRLIETKIV